VSKKFVQNLTRFFTEPIPVLTKDDLAMLEHLDKKLDQVITLLEQSPEPKTTDQTTTVTSPDIIPLKTNLDDLTNQVRKLAKTQFKTNTLQESQLSQQQKTLESLQQTIQEKEQQLVKQQAQTIDAAKLDIMKSLLPVMDSLDAAFDIGRRQVLNLPLEPEIRKPIIAWLDGLRLARIRLLDVLKSHDVTPIVSVGKLFNPHHHVAVATDQNRNIAEGTIVSEDRRGYKTSTKIIREAEVTVAKTR